MKPTQVEISPRSVVVTIVIIITFILAWKLRFIVISLLTAFILMTGFALLADFLHSRGLGKTTSAVLAYILSISVLGITIFFIFPPLIVQVREFVNNLPEYINRFTYLYVNNQIPGIDNRDIASILTSRIDSILGNALSFLVSTVNVIVNFITIAVISFYMLLERDRIKNNLFRLFPNLPKDQVTNLAHKVERQLGNWLKGEVMLMIIIGVATYVGLRLLGVEYALPLAIIAGLLEAIPVVGPILSAVPALLITVTISPISAIGVGLLYILIQQLENNIVVPKVMQNATGLDPLLTIVSILIGANLFGLAGAIVAVPTAAIVQVLIAEFVGKGP
ncbi:MAG TPA: AI-2E family transporter [Candidatus Nanoarchaeia archaeon]|nr:hypothetical protein [uncultured archaeon]